VHNADQNQLTNELKFALIECVKYKNDDLTYDAIELVIDSIAAFDYIKITRLIIQKILDAMLIDLYKLGYVSTYSIIKDMLSDIKNDNDNTEYIEALQFTLNKLETIKIGKPK
jgi:hypothetical protein